MNALLKGLALFKGVKVTIIPFSDQASLGEASCWESSGISWVTTNSIEAFTDVDAIYISGPQTLSHLRLLKDRNTFNLRIDHKFMGMLQDHCIIMDPVQRTGAFDIDVQDRRIAFDGRPRISYLPGWLFYHKGCQDSDVNHS